VLERIEGAVLGPLILLAVGMGWALRAEVRFPHAHSEFAYSLMP